MTINDKFPNMKIDDLQASIKMGEFLTENFQDIYKALTSTGGQKLIELLDKECDGNNLFPHPVEEANFLLGKIYMCNLLKKLSNLDNLDKLERAQKDKKELYEAIVNGEDYD